MAIALVNAVGLPAYKAYSFEPPANSEEAGHFFSSARWTNLVSSVNAVADLAAQLNWNTNEDMVSAFDKRVCESLGLRPKSPVFVSYKELSLVIHLPTTNECFDSSQEMGGSLNLIYSDKKIVRTNSEAQVPANYIRLYDPKVKELTVEIDLLLSTMPLDRPQEVKYLRRSFRFVHRNRWVND